MRGYTRKEGKEVRTRVAQRTVSMMLSARRTLCLDGLREWSGLCERPTHQKYVVPLKQWKREWVSDMNVLE